MRRITVASVLAAATWLRLRDIDARRPLVLERHGEPDSSPERLLAAHHDADVGGGPANLL
jgi:hypothetical protein